MKISLYFTGKTSENYLNEGISLYEKRIKRYSKFELKIIQDIKKTKNLPVNVIKVKEGDEILKKINSEDYLVLLDEKGKMFDSIEFAKFLENKAVTGTRHLVFLIGGAYGFSEKLYKRADFKISLSKMTFSHQPVRLLFIEQLYRAFTILKGEPYHNV